MGCNPLNKFQIIVEPLIKKLTKINGIRKKAKKLTGIDRIFYLFNRIYF